MLLLSLALTACGRSGEPVPNAAAPATAANVATAAPRPPVTPQATCAPAPTLVLSEDFADPHHAFAPDSAAFQRLQVDFASAYRGACEGGMLRGRALIAAGAADRDRLRLKNAPDANIASIYLDGEDDAPAARRHMVIEYPFLTGDGATHTPSPTDLREAIFCAVQGASQGEEEESGRCLPD